MIKEDFEKLTTSLKEQKAVAFVLVVGELKDLTAKVQEGSIGFFHQGKLLDIIDALMYIMNEQPEVYDMLKASVSLFEIQARGREAEIKRLKKEGKLN